VAQTLSQPGQTAASAGLKPLKVGLDLSLSVDSPPRISVATPTTRHDQNLNRLWISSLFAVAAASGIDAASSWGKPERNGLLASSDGTFGMRGAAFKGAMVAAVIVPQILLRHHKKLRTQLAIENLAEAGFFTGVAIHNFGVTSSGSSNRGSQ
jgi:hypothetical protein